MTGLITKKIGMSRIFMEGGRVVPVTYLKVLNNAIVGVREKERDGYNAVVVGANAKKRKTRKGNERTIYGMLKEFVVDSLDGIEVGSRITADIVPVDSKVTVVGISRGKGFSGVIKRHNFSRGPETHGSHHHREPGSVGMCDMPGKVLKGKKMPGRMGGHRVTLRGCNVVVSIPEEDLIAVDSPVPGANGTTVVLSVESLPAKST